MTRTSLSLCVLATVVAMSPADAIAHGTMVIPESRVYNCYLNNPENPSDPACAAAKAVAGPQAFYDWNGINQGNANGNHRAVVPDGQLCSGGNAKFAGLDLPRSDWQATPIANGTDGKFEFVFHGTAPHATRDWVFYVTRESWSPTQPLKWGDMFEFCRFNSVPLTGDKYKMKCALPQLTGKHVIYTTWQRSDSAEAFYTCTDVQLAGGSSSPWVDEGPLTAQSDLSTGSKVTLRLFNSNGNDVESIAHTIAAGQGAAADWPFHFAQTVNAQSQYARVGLVDGTGNIAPVHAANGNRVYTQASANLNHAVDIATPGGGNRPPVAAVSANPTAITGAGNVALSATGSSDPDGQSLSYQWQIVAGSQATLSAATGAQTTLQLAAPTQNQTISVRVTVSDGQASDSETVNIAHSANGGGSYDYVYPAGIGSYVPGQTIVLGSDGYHYKCRPRPNGDWCNINSALYYAPGTGLAWQDAWTRL